MTTPRILVADDDPMIRDILCDIILDMGYAPDFANTAAETVKKAGEGRWDAILLDLRFPDCTDLSTLEKLRKIAPDTHILLITAETGDLSVVADAVRMGVFDYVPKPVREDDIRIRLTRVMEMRLLSRSHNRAVAELAKGREFSDIIGKSPTITMITEQASQLANYDVPVLITGETGTGKELVARALHYGGERRNRPFVSLNCAALPQSLVESELFGHEKGSFTGANNNRNGAFADAEDGTLFLDEIGDMDLQAQAALLHVLENGEYRSVGGAVKKTTARVVLATNQDLEALIEENRFRKDLFYRINRMKIQLPPLRERPGDIPLLTGHFLRLIENKIGKGISAISQEAEAALCKYNWPGNVRELRNEIERAYILTNEKRLEMLDLSPEIMAFSTINTENCTDSANPQSLGDLHRLVDALRASGGNISKAASTLGVHRNTVHRWMKKFSLLRDNME